MLSPAPYVMGMGLAGLPRRVLLRSTAGAISSLLAGALLPDSYNGLQKYLPSDADSAFTPPIPADSLLGADTGALVSGACIVVALVGAVVCLTPRDA